MTKSFNDDDSCDVFLISTRAGGVGFNLYGANRVVLFDFSFNPTWEEQAIGRAFRLGQQKPVFVYRFITAGTFEEALFNQTVFKLQLAYQVVEKKNTRSKALRTRDYIKMPALSCLADLSEGKGHDQVLDDIIKNMDIGSELIHDLNLDTTFKEEVNEALDEEGRKEMEALVQQNQLRNADPEAYRAQLAARMYGLPSTARAGRIGPTAKFPAAFPSDPAAIPPARSVGSALDVPSAARLPLGGALNAEPHGLPFVAPPDFSVSGLGGGSSPSAGAFFSPAYDGAPRVQQDGQS
jgi:hypothetical protein